MNEEEIRKKLRLLDKIDEVADNDPSKFFEAWFEVRSEILAELRKIKQKQKGNKHEQP